MALCARVDWRIIHSPSLPISLSPSPAAGLDGEFDLALPLCKGHPCPVTNAFDKRKQVIRLSARVSSRWCVHAASVRPSDRDATVSGPSRYGLNMHNIHRVFPRTHIPLSHYSYSPSPLPSHSFPPVYPFSLCYGSSSPVILVHCGAAHH